MAQIIRDPLVEDTLKEVDVSLPGAYDEARQLYEAGHLVLLKNQTLNLDYDFLNSLDFDIPAPDDVRRKIKKYGDAKILNLRADGGDAIDRFVFDEIFLRDNITLEKFQAQVVSGNSQISDIYKKIFPNYQDFKRVFTWRFTETLFENLHWDNFGTQDRFHQVRIFANVDRHPRLWRTSHTIESYAERIYDENGLAQFADKSGDELNYTINNKVLGGMASACLEGLPKHHIAFAQGDVWLCETRIVSHQIYQGHKAIASMFYVDPATMDRPELGFDARIAALHSRHATAPADPT